jgi:hypothetical protein
MEPGLYEKVRDGKVGHASTQLMTGMGTPWSSEGGLNFSNPERYVAYPAYERIGGATWTEGDADANWETRVFFYAGQDGNVTMDVSSYGMLDRAVIRGIVARAAQHYTALDDEGQVALAGAAVPHLRDLVSSAGTAYAQGQWTGSLPMRFNGEIPTERVGRTPAFGQIDIARPELVVSPTIYIRPYGLAYMFDVPETEAQFRANATAAFAAADLPPPTFTKLSYQERVTCY